MKTLQVLLFSLFLNCGNALAQFAHQFRHHDMLREVLILSSEKQLGKELILTGKVKAPEPIGFKKYDFDAQLDRIAAKAIEVGANVILIDKIELVGTYRLKGRAYKAKDYELFKNVVLQAKKEKLAAKTKCATLTLYKSKRDNIQDFAHVEVFADNERYLIKRNTKIRLLYDTAAEVTLKIKGNKTDSTIKLKCGEETYVHCMAYPGHTPSVAVNSIAVPVSGYIRSIEIVDPRIGELESSKIDLTVD